ncbi:hypothetical protein [Sphingobium sp. SA916]|uniref:hypothetical protein n=1 Tax=Sphingobium sp. SA916 TaxID=1851207 RepID=UPI001558B20A|nr:hypothetical protein [Sphingobium sp. SA916]
MASREPLDRVHLLWVLVMFESYNANGKVQYSSRFPHPRLTLKATQTTVDAGYGSQAVGSLSKATFSYTATNPMPAFRVSSGGFTVTATVNTGGNNWTTEVLVSAGIGATVTMYLFDTTAPVPGAAGTARMESWDPSGNLIFALSMQPARIVGKTGSGSGNGFTGSPARRYAALMPTYHQRIAVNDTGNVGSPTRYTVNYYNTRISIDDAAGTVQSLQSNYRRFGNATNPGNSTYGSPRSIVFDVTNY